CTPTGTGKDGDTCKSDADCASTLRCTIVGLSTQCKPEGKNDVGKPCTTAADCFGGLVCYNKQCEPPPPGFPTLGVPSFQGVECKDDTGAVKAYFRIPRGTGDGDFFRLPFPNDVRI